MRQNDAKLHQTFRTLGKCGILRSLESNNRSRVKNVPAVHKSRIFMGKNLINFVRRHVVKLVRLQRLSSWNVKHRKHAHAKWIHRKQREPSERMMIERSTSGLQLGVFYVWLVCRRANLFGFLLDSLSRPGHWTRRSLSSGFCVSADQTLSAMAFHLARFDESHRERDMTCNPKKIQTN